MNKKQQEQLAQWHQKITEVANEIAAMNLGTLPDNELIRARKLLELNGYAVISLSEVMPSLGPVKRGIFDTIRQRNGATVEQIRISVWGNDPNGGPADPVIHAHISQLKKMLHKWGMTITSSGGWYKTYLLVTLKSDKVETGQ